MKYLKENLLNMTCAIWSKETNDYIEKLSYILSNDTYVDDLKTKMNHVKEFVWKKRSDHNAKLYPGVRVKFKTLTPEQLGSTLSEKLRKDDGYYYGWISDVLAFPGDPIHLYITVIDIDDKVNIKTVIADQRDVTIVEELPETILNDLYEYSRLYHGEKNSLK